MPPQPLILDDVGIKISKDGTTVGLTALECSGNHVEISPDTAITTLDTFCGSTDYPGITKWSLLLTLYQSFDVGGPDEVLKAAVALPTTVFEITPRKSTAISVTNPVFTGTVVPRPYAPINGDAGDASTIELEWSLVGEPTQSSTAPIGTEAASGGSGDLSAMTLAELQAEAATRGLATTGTKAELIDRLS